MLGFPNLTVSQGFCFVLVWFFQITETDLSDFISKNMHWRAAGLLIEVAGR